MVKVFRFGHLGERDTTLFNYLLKETGGDKKEFDEIMRARWPNKDSPRGTEEVRRYFFQTWNTKLSFPRDYHSIAIPYVVTDLNAIREREGIQYAGVQADFFGPFSELKKDFSEIEYPPRVLSEGIRRFKLNKYWGKRLKLEDILVVRGEHIVDYLPAKKSEELAKLLEGIKVS